MRIRLILPLVALAAATAAFAAPAPAATVVECQQLISTLQTQTAATTFFGRRAATDQANLITKLTNASVKLDQGKFADAIQKLTDYRTKVVALGAEGKIDPTAVPTLLAGADAAIACISSLSP